MARPVELVPHSSRQPSESGTTLTPAHRGRKWHKVTPPGNGRIRSQAGLLVPTSTSLPAAPASSRVCVYQNHLCTEASPTPSPNLFWILLLPLSLTLTPSTSRHMGQRVSNESMSVLEKLMDNGDIFQKTREPMPGVKMEGRTPTKDDVSRKPEKGFSKYSFLYR